MFVLIIESILIYFGRKLDNKDKISTECKIDEIIKTPKIFPLN